MGQRGIPRCLVNFPNFNASPGAHQCADVSGEAINEEHYGWVVEIDPYGQLPPLKHTALGRFEHESAAVTVGRNSKLVFTWVATSKEVTSTSS